MVRTEFAYLHVHSWFSERTGVASVSELVSRAAALEIRTLALTDFCSMAGVPEFVDLCRHNGIHGIPGVELPVVVQSEEKRFVDRIVFLAQNNDGYSNLTRLLSSALANGAREPLSETGDPPAWISINQLSGALDNVIAIAGVQSSLVETLVAEDDQPRASVYLQHLAHLLGPRNLALGVPSAARQAAYKALAHGLNLPIVATPPVRYLFPADRLAFLYLSGEPCPHSFSPTATAAATDIPLSHLARSHEVCQHFGNEVGLLHESIRIADRCRALTGILRTRFPVPDLPRGCTPETFLNDLLLRQVALLYPDRSETVRDRVMQEFNVVVQEGLAEKLILVHALVNHCRQKGITLGVGSGTLVTSVIAYLLGLTQVDPIFFHLNFCGFLERQGGSDYDAFLLEMPSEAASTILEFFDQTAGARTCARVARYVPPARPALVRDLSEWLGVPVPPLNSVAQDKRDAFRQFDSFVRAPLGVVNLPDPQVLGFLLSRLLGRPAELASAEDELAISGEPLDNIVALAVVEGEPCTQCNSAALNIYRVPRLLLSSSQQLRVLDAAARWIREEDDELNISQVSLDDPRTYELLRRGLTLGIEPFHTMSMRMRLRREAPKNFNCLLKARAAEAAQRGEPHDIRHFIPECLLAYRLAYAKAHFPACFFAAIFSRMALGKSRRRLAPLLREAREMGLRILPPDINRSGYFCSVDGNAVRLGLCLVKGLGERTYREIEAARNSGEFEDLLDLRRRTDRRLVNNTILENLARAGALDSFELNRHELLALIDQIRRSEARHLDDYFSPAFDLQPPELPPPTPRELLTMELDAADVPLSCDPLRIFSTVVRRSGARHPGEIGRRNVGREVTLVGYVNQLDEPYGDGAPVDHYYVDFDGFALVVPHKVKQVYEAELASHEPLLVVGVPHSTADGDFVVKANALFTLSQVEELARQVRSVTVDLGQENFRTVWLLRRIIAAYRRGTTRFIVAPPPPATPARLLALLMSRRKVFFCPPLFYQLKKVLTENQITIDFVDENAREWAMHLLRPFHTRKAGSSDALPAVAPHVTPASIRLKE
jgi:DNA polymerase III alpha subunit